MPTAGSGNAGDRQKNFVAVHGEKVKQIVRGEQIRERRRAIKLRKPPPRTAEISSAQRRKRHSGAAFRATEMHKCAQTNSVSPILSKQGLKFVISTHSPVITQEMNNMIMFEKCKDKIDDEIIKEYSIDRQNYGLRQEDVNIYFLNNKTIEQAEFGEDGVITETFNEVLGEIDNLYQELLFAMEEE